MHGYKLHCSEDLEPSVMDHGINSSEVLEHNSQYHKKYFGQPAVFDLPLFNNLN